MKFNEIIVADATKLDKDQQEFLMLHNSIIANGNAAAVCFIETARGLKEMRDSGKYKAAGFETFGEYSEAACGLKERQAYSYISVVENLSQEFLQTSAKIGVSKLSILASMSTKDREDLIANHGSELDDLSTRDLDKLKKEYEGRIQQLQLDFETQLKLKEETIEELCDSIDEIGAINYSSDIKRLEDEKAELERELEGIKKAPQKVDEKTAVELAKVKEEVKKLKDEKAAAERKVKEEKEKSEKEIAAIIEKEREAAKAIEKDLELERARLEAEAKKVKIAADPLMSEFKVKFALWQELGNRLKDIATRVTEEANAEKCRKAFNSIIGGWANEKA